GLQPTSAAAHPRFSEHSARARDHRHHQVEQGRGHRRGLRPVAGGHARVSLPMTVAVSTLGCRLNQVESQEGLALLESRGVRAAAAGERARIHIVNTCTVTGRADFSDRQVIRRVARETPDALLVVTGCYAQTDAETVARIPGVDLVVGNQEKYRLP